MTEKCICNSLAASWNKDCRGHHPHIQELKKAKTEFDNELRILVTNASESFDRQFAQLRENRKEFFEYVAKCLHGEIDEIESETENVC